jgi:glutathione S-transferase
MIKLFYAPGTCALAPHIVLEWVGQPYELERVQLSNPDYLKINPLGQVPAMIDGDSGVMNQADALLKYLAHKYPDAGLGSNGMLRDEYELNRWLAFLTGDVHPAFYPFFRPKRYWLDEDETALKSIRESSYARIDTLFSYLDGHLEGKEFVVGDRRTIVDPYAFIMIHWGTFLPKSLSDYANLYHFYQHMLEDAGVQQAMEREGVKSGIK